ncbi:PadR family transcriptional regulator [Paenibacillus sp. JCM 10914]|uniref:PadR family transcriptional regulator n=1 Tax=Paenibacillus sp. JCM 10914 TaxID=1236974 RepID=UPI0003CC83C1|nr:PadR family transcriptional regulator [Paenibacillus sp. JCM 10914]GAE09522.1 transcriptional regulator, PadR family [Paenibacillus sp. JCM 10914]
MNINEWISQVRRGILEYSILLLLKQKKRYGYEFTALLSKWEILSVTEGTLYPLLRRLSKEKYIESFWQESTSGPPRKYYILSPLGKELLEEMSEEWGNLVDAIQQIDKSEQTEEMP